MRSPMCHSRNRAGKWAMATFRGATLTCLLSLLGREMASAQDNSCVTVILSARSGMNPACAPDFDCVATQPRVRLDNPSGPFMMSMSLRNYEQVSGVQVAFDWPFGWIFSFGLWDCRGTQLSTVVPTAPGPITGTIATTFNPISGGALEPIGHMLFLTPSSGCLSIIESGYPFGNHVIDEQEARTSIRDENEGRICVNSDGVNACLCQKVTPAEAVTWGRIKATYGQ